MNSKERQLYRQSVDMFIDMLQIVTKRKVNYKCNNSDVCSFETFCKEFDVNSIGTFFIKSYLEYQFQSWFNDKVKEDYSRRVRFCWMFGQKGISRWRKFTPEINAKIVRKGIKKTGIYNPTISINTNLPELILRVRDVEEKFKEDYHNTNRGFLWCIANTTLYFHKSSKCATCNFKTECKELLKQEFPKIYIKRGYGKK